MTERHGQSEPQPDRNQRSRVMSLSGYRLSALAAYGQTLSAAAQHLE